MTWFAFPGGWGDYDLNGLAEKQLAATGAHGYGTQAEADAHVNASPNVLQQAILTQYKLESVSPIGAGAGGILQTPNSTGGVTGALKNFLGGNSSGWLLRTAEILLGLGLIITALAKLASGTTVGQAASRAGKAAAFA